MPQIPAPKRGSSRSRDQLDEDQFRKGKGVMLATDTVEVEDPFVLDVHIITDVRPGEVATALLTTARSPVKRSLSPRRPTIWLT